MKEQGTNLIMTPNSRSIRSIIGILAASLLFSHSLAQEIDSAHLVNLVEAAARLPDFDRKVETPEKDGIAIRSPEEVRIREASSGFRIFLRSREREGGSLIPLYGRLLAVLVNRIEANEQMNIPMGCIDFGPPDEISKEIHGLVNSGSQ